MAEILIVREPVAKETLRKLVDELFGDMVKFVTDVERGLIAVGGELHADAEALLLEDGSQQEDLWGANYSPGTSLEDCIEYTSLINIRPGQGNPGMELMDPALRRRVMDLTHRLIGRGETL